MNLISSQVPNPTTVWRGRRLPFLFLSGIFFFIDIFIVSPYRDESTTKQAKCKSALCSDFSETNLDNVLSLHQRCFEAFKQAVTGKEDRRKESQNHTAKHKQAVGQYLNSLLCKLSECIASKPEPKMESSPTGHLGTSNALT